MGESELTWRLRGILVVELLSWRVDEIAGDADALGVALDSWLAMPAYRCPCILARCLSILLGQVT
jgi:hypothetical protein